MVGEGKTFYGVNVEKDGDFRWLGYQYSYDNAKKAILDWHRIKE